MEGMTLEEQQSMCDNVTKVLVNYYSSLSPKYDSTNLSTH
jgi:DNA-binding protein Fis